MQGHSFGKRCQNELCFIAQLEHVIGALLKGKQTCCTSAQPVRTALQGAETPGSKF